MPNLFSPLRKDARQLVVELDEGILALEKSGKIKEILARYGIHEWKGSTKSK